MVFLCLHTLNQVIKAMHEMLCIMEYKKYAQFTKKRVLKIIPLD